MNIPNIEVRIQLGHEHKANLRVFVIPLDGLDLASVFGPLDFPVTPFDGVCTEEYLCTPRSMRERILKNRKDFANSLASELTERILEAVGKDDTVMGYPKE